MNWSSTYGSRFTLMIIEHFSLRSLSFFRAFIHNNNTISFYNTMRFYFEILQVDKTWSSSNWKLQIWTEFFISLSTAQRLFFKGFILKARIELRCDDKLHEMIPTVAAWERWTHTGLYSFISFTLFCSFIILMSVLFISGHSSFWKEHFPFFFFLYSHTNSQQEVLYKNVSHWLN